MKIVKGDFLAVGLTVTLLAGAAADRISLLAPKDSGPYHRMVKSAAAAVLLNFGDWVGTDVAVPPEASAQLHPNVIISRQFKNIVTGEQVSFLLVQCPDIRDLTPHYPPVCYPGRGLALTSAVPKDWRADQLTVQGTEYQFESNTFQTDKLTVVANFMVLPDGRTCRDMTEVRKQAGLRTRFYGAAQIQVVFSSDTTTERRDQICDEIIAAYMPLISVIRTGVGQ